MIERVAPYTEDYKTECKHAWYSAGCPTRAKDFITAIPEDEHHRKPTIQLLRNWRRDYMWDAWADVMNSKALAAAEDDLVSKKAEMLKRHAARSVEWQDEAWNYVKEKGFDSSASAVQAFFRAVETERESLGIGEALLKLAKMDNEEMLDEFMKLVHRGSENNQLNPIDAETVPEEKEGEDG